MKSKQQKDNKIEESKDQLKVEQEQFQSTYLTLRELKPELFAIDRAAQFIKVDGFIEDLSPDMQNFAQLHEGLDYVENKSPPKLQEQIKGKIEDFIESSKGVWDRWWANKLKSNQQMIAFAKKGSYEDVARVIDANYNDDSVASVNYQEPQTGFTALHWAAKLGNLQLINLLISNNADAMVSDGKGQTPLHLACQKGDVEAYKAIVGYCYGAKNCVDKANKTPLDYAIEFKQQNIIDLDKKMTVTLYAHNSKNPTSQRLRPDDFEVIMPLGKGAFGEVLLVQKSNHYYAMKVMKKRKYNGLINLVLTEKEVQRKVKHRFIVQLKYAFQTFEKLFLVSEFCQGGDLRALVLAKKRLTESDARLYLAEILVAIEELHRNGIIHRDIKLDNILLDKDGHVKITDFGLSKEGMFEKKLTTTMLGGGRSYQIPEVISEMAYDKSVDIYLFGLLAYEIMTGVPAFPPDIYDLELKILRSEYNLPMELTPEARDIIQKLIVPNPEQRLSIKQIKKHQFFNKVEWKQVSEGKLQMPQPILRPIMKSSFPVNLLDSDDEEYDAYDQKVANFEENAAGLNTKINGQAPIEFVFDDQSMNWVPKTMDTKLLANQKQNAGGYDQFDDLGANMNMTKIPNFSFHDNPANQMKQQ